MEKVYFGQDLMIYVVKRLGGFATKQQIIDELINLGYPSSIHTAHRVLRKARNSHRMAFVKVNGKEGWVIDNSEMHQI